MNKDTLVALRGSIAKWEAIVNGTGVDGGTDNCPLCKLFYSNRGEDGVGPLCFGYPVRNNTEMGQCDGSPYVYRVMHHDEAHGHELPPFEVHPGCDTCRALAEAELEFLKGLLP